MAIFLFLKQIIDIFYDYKFLDYIMAILAVVIVCYQLWMLRNDKGDASVKIKISLSDLCIIGTLIIFAVHMIIDEKTDIFTSCKILTAFLLYLIGRLCRERVEECTWALVASSYIVVYANVIARLFMFGASQFFSMGDSEGLLYYFDTDLAYAMLLALVFIAMYARNHIIKFVTIFAVCPFMILHSDADIQKLLMIVVYIILFLFMAERAVKKRKFTDYLLPIGLICMLVVIATLLLPVFGIRTDNALLSGINNFINTDNFAGRYIGWRGLLKRSMQGDVINLLFGNALITSRSVANEYLSIFIGLGAVGLSLTLIFILSIAASAVHIESRKTYYVTVMLAIIFLGTCIVVNGLEFTQMSWLPMMYAGMAAGHRKSK